MQHGNNAITNALELLQFCTKQPIYTYFFPKLLLNFHSIEAFFSHTLCSPYFWSDIFFFSTFHNCPGLAQDSNSITDALESPQLSHQNIFFPHSFLIFHWVETCFITPFVWHDIFFFSPFYNCSVCQMLGSNQLVTWHAHTQHGSTPQ